MKKIKKLSKEILDDLNNYLDRNFPKGNKKRGDVFVLTSLACLYGKELEKEEIIELIKWYFDDCKTNHKWVKTMREQIIDLIDNDNNRIKIYPEIKINKNKK